MKFFHLADLHFGKTLHNVQLVEEDQPFWVEEFLKKVDEYNPDAIVLAGDIYDRRNPSLEAMKLFDHFLTELAHRDKYVFIIPGNHDSDVRLSHVNELLEDHKIFIVGELKKELTHVTVPSEDGEVTFWLMPYIFPKLVASPNVLNNPEINSYDMAAKALIEAQDIDEGKNNVLVAHQNVLAFGKKPEFSGSEIIIGGLGEIEYTTFDKFKYVALGHIHRAQKVGREEVRYAGCPMYYDFSEINLNKDLTLVNIDAGGSVTVERVGIPLLHTLEQVEGTLDELLDMGRAMTDKDKKYIQAVLKDKHVPARALEQLRDVYGNSLVNTKRGFEVSVSTGGVNVAGGKKELSVEEQFAAFYQEFEGELLDGDQEDIIKKIIEQQENKGQSYFYDFKNVPEKDSEELIELLMKMTEENK